MRGELTGPTGNLYSSGRHLDSRAADLWFDTSEARGKALPPRARRVRDA